MMSNAMKCVKYILFVFNFIFFLAGLALVITGALVETTFSEYFSFFSGRINFAAIFLIIVGIVIFCVAFFGCCGAIKESYGMIVTYAVLLGIVVLLEVAAALAVYFSRQEIEEKLSKRMKKTIPDYSEGKRGIKRSWDAAQKTLKCCGANDYQDWGDNSQMNVTFSVPDSCCSTIPQDKDCGKGALLSGAGIYKQGCALKLKEMSEQKIGLLSGVALGFAVFQLVGVVIAICLAYSIRKDYHAV